MPKQILLKRFLAVMLMCMMGISLYAQSQTVRGTVKDQTGEPIPGATVLEQGTENGVITDIDGNYSLKVKPGAMLVISYVGYESQTLAAKSVLNITMAEDQELIEEVVVVGYGVQKKKLFTGANINISGDAISKQNSTNALGALYSSVPGVNIVKSNGQPGANYNITVRGLGTTGSSGPLYVIDGIVAEGSSAINSLNPSDIESVDLLKDAASASIYGARAANGVLLITTKQGEKGKAKINYDFYYAWQKPNFNGVKSVSAMEYIELVDQAFKSNGTPFNSADHYFDLETDMPIQWAQIKNGTWNGTDWLHESTNPNAGQYNHAVSITGGSDRSHYALGFTKSYQEGTLGYPKETYYDRTTIRMNTDYVLLQLKGRDILKIGENATLSIYDSNSVSQGNIYSNSIHTALIYTPLLPAYKEDGSFYTWDDQVKDGWQQTDGAYNLLEEYSLGTQENKTYRLQSNAWLEFTPHKDFKFRSVIGWHFASKASRSYTPAYKISAKKSEEFDKVQQDASVSNRKSWENTLYWSHKYGDHSVDALIGNSIETVDWGMSVGGSRKETLFGTWESANLSSSASDIDSQMVGIWGGNTVPYNEIISFFGRANYNYKETYMATVILRRDGSCNFASGHRWKTYPSVSAGWVLTNENFMESTQSWMDFFKLRASWGRNGNCNVANWQYAANVTLDNRYDFTSGGTSASVAGYPKNIANPSLTWETSEQLDLGFDARFFNSRLGVNFDWYKKNTKDWIVLSPVSLATDGAEPPYINGGEVENRGVELALTWNDRLGDFHYGISLNGAYNKNEMIYINNADGIIKGGTNVLAQNLDTYWTYEARAGKPLGYFTGIASDGIFQNQAEIDAWNAAGKAFMDGYEKAQPGDVKWIDQNGDGKFDNDDVVEIGNPHPDVTLGFDINMSWKGFDFSMSGSGAFGHQILQSYRSFANSDFENYTNNFVDRLWTGEGSTNSFPRFTYGKHNNFYCKGYVGDIWAQDADYVKIRTITLGYDFKQLFKKMPLQQCRIYVSGQNLLTFTGYDGMDPEVGYGYGDSWTSGIDIGAYPNPKSFMVGCNLKF